MLEWPSLKYYESPDSAAPKGVIDCSQVTLNDELAYDKTGKEFCFGIFHPHNVRTILCRLMGSRLCGRDAKPCGLGGSSDEAVPCEGLVLPASRRPSGDDEVDRRDPVRPVRTHADAS